MSQSTRGCLEKLLHVNCCVRICSHGGDCVFWSTLQQGCSGQQLHGINEMCLHDQLHYVSFYEKTFGYVETLATVYLRVFDLKMLSCHIIKYRLHFFFSVTLQC